MREMKIGDVAKRAGVAPSTIRYYEKSGLLPVPRRQSKQRRYDPVILGYLEIIRIAREAGLNVRETRALLRGSGEDATPAVRWESLARDKLKQLDALEERMRVMRSLLQSEFHCACATVKQCAEGLARKDEKCRPPRREA